MNAQTRVAKWVLETFGPETAMNAPERSLRTAEEALELAQACGVRAETLHKLVDYVFARPVGEPGQEIAGTLVCLYSAAATLGIDADRAFEHELARIQQPEVVERCRRRQGEKRAALVTGEGTVLANVLGPWPPPRSSIKDVDAVEMYKVCNIEFHPSEDVITRAPPELERIHKALVGRHDK